MGAASVVFDGNGAVIIDLDGNGGGETCHGFDDGVVVALFGWQSADEVMESSARRIADVHWGTQENFTVERVLGR